MATKQRRKVEVENINHPGRVWRVDADMYAAMKRACLKVLPKGRPGLTLAQLRERLVPHLPENLYPGGAKAGWWLKLAQLDLEAKGFVVRENTQPLRLHRA